MQEHYHLSDASFAALSSSGITARDLYLTAQLLDPYNKGVEASVLGLLYYIDAKGDFRSKPQFPHRKIVSAFFETLTTKEKMFIFDYIEMEDEDDE